MATRMTSFAAILNILPFARDKNMEQNLNDNTATFTVDIIVLRSKMASEMTVKLIISDLVDTFIIM